MQECYEMLSLDISRFQSKGKIILLGDFNARVGKGLDSDDVVSLYGEDICNSNGSKLIELMQQLNLMLWNCREFCIEPQWTRIMPKLEQYLIVDYVASDRDLDNLFVLNEVIQGRLQEGKKTFSFFLDIKKAYDTVWQDGLWYRMWEMGIQGKLWRVIRNIYNVNQSCFYLDGSKSEYFDITQGVAQGCTLSPTLFLIFVDGLMKEIESKVSSLPSLQVNGLLFADDFVGLSDSKEGL